MQIYKLAPIVNAFGSVALPGSKSISNRVLLMAALANGVSHLTGVLRADDTDRMLDALKILGFEVQAEGDRVSIIGESGKVPSKQGDLFVGNAGTATRFLTALLAFADGHYRMDGIARMRERPISDLLVALRELGADISCTENEGFLPLQFAPARPRSNVVHIKGNVSSQYLTALLIIAPLIASEQGLEIVIEGELISRPYVEMTTALMRQFGVQVETTRQGYLIRPSVYQAQENYQVEADASGASYFLALGALVGGPVTVIGVGARALQGDVAFADALASMGATVQKQAHSITVSRDKNKLLQGLTMDCTEIPDAAMTFVPMALCTQGPVHLTGIGSWRVKETDRLQALVTEMQKFGALVEFGQDWIKVQRPDSLPTSVRVTTYDDHRMAMSLSLAACAGVEVQIEDPACTAKTFPNYFELLEKLCVHTLM